MFMSSGLHSPPFSLNPFSNDFLWLFGTDVTPILLGMQKPVHVLQRGGTVQDVVNLVTIASVDVAGRIEK